MSGERHHLPHTMQRRRAGTGVRTNADFGSLLSISSFGCLRACVAMPPPSSLRYLATRRAPLRLTLCVEALVTQHRSKWIRLEPNRSSLAASLAIDVESSKCWHRLSPFPSSLLLHGERRAIRPPSAPWISPRCLGSHCVPAPRSRASQSAGLCFLPQCRVRFHPGTLLALLARVVLSVPHPSERQ